MTEQSSTTRQSSSGQDELDAAKAALRKDQGRIRAAARDASPDAAETLAGHAQALIERLPVTADAIIAGYWPIRSELTPLPLMAALVARGMRTALPATPQPGQPLVFHHWQEGDALIEGLYGTSEPPSTAPLCVPDVLLVPMLAFDRLGYRLGYGGGFYDRTLAAIRPEKPLVRAVGIAYAEQQVDAVPVGDHDASLDAILTPSGLTPSGLTPSGLILPDPAT
ncbi:MAG: 5-formyltetrahydrofolate cyclo-ligase [SAR116 cluster bacterium MED-G04]|jgi:5-formyltetrahydrofolate cyclo-ligase|nr:MAG: 5-formyltetrahydrofolate cyclo-ligase [SAR116 cluster bacterium MED-G04]